MESRQTDRSALMSAFDALRPRASAEDVKSLRDLLTELTAENDELRSMASRSALRAWRSETDEAKARERCDEMRSVYREMIEEWERERRSVDLERALERARADQLAERHDRARARLDAHALDAYCAHRGVLGWRATTALHGRSINAAVATLLQRIALHSPIGPGMSRQA